MCPYPPTPDNFIFGDTGIPQRNRGKSLDFLKQHYVPFHLFGNLRVANFRKDGHRKTPTERLKNIENLGYGINIYQEIKWKLGKS